MAPSPQLPGPGASSGFCGGGDQLWPRGSSVTGGWASSRLPPWGHLPVPLPWADGSVPGGGVQREGDGGSALHPGDGWGLPAAVLFLWPLPPAELDALGCARADKTGGHLSQRAQPDWTGILFIAEDEQGRLVFTTLIG